jgi:hypothetical protein
MSEETNNSAAPTYSKEQIDKKLVSTYVVGRKGWF